MSCNEIFFDRIPIARTISLHAFVRFNGPFEVGWTRILPCSYLFLSFRSLQPCMIVFNFIFALSSRVINLKILIAQPLVKTYRNHLRFQYCPVEYVYAHLLRVSWSHHPLHPSENFSLPSFDSFHTCPFIWAPSSSPRLSSDPLHGRIFFSIHVFFSCSPVSCHFSLLKAIWDVLIENLIILIKDLRADYVILKLWQLCNLSAFVVITLFSATA